MSVRFNGTTSSQSRPKSLRDVAKALTPPFVWDLLSTMRNGRVAPMSVFQGVATSHSMKKLHEGPFGAALDRYAKLDPHSQPEDLRLRVYLATYFAHRSTEVTGDFVAAGISYGVAARVMYDVVGFEAGKRRFHLVDKFTGAHDSGHLSVYNTDASYVRKQYPEGAAVVFHEAHIPDAFPLPHVDAIAFAHLNTGVVPAETASLPYLYERLSPGGSIVIDKYCFGEGHEAEYDAVAKKVGAEIFSMVTGQGVLSKARS